MYRVSPFTYLVEGMLTTGIANQKIHCAANEYVQLNAPGGQTCGEYLKPYIARGSYVKDPSSTGTCEFCSYQDSNTFLGLIGLDYANAWRDFGILWVYIIFNIFAAVGIYWLARVPKKSKHRKAEEKTAKAQEKAA